MNSMNKTNKKQKAKSKQLRPAKTPASPKQGTKANPYDCDDCPDLFSDNEILLISAGGMNNYEKMHPVEKYCSDLSPENHINSRKVLNAIIDAFQEFADIFVFHDISIERTDELVQRLRALDDDQTYQIVSLITRRMIRLSLVLIDFASNKFMNRDISNISALES